MSRRERRAEIRLIIKELEEVQKNRVFVAAMQDKEFADIVRTNIVELKSGTYKDTNILFKYGAVINILQNVQALEGRLRSLQVGPEPKKNIPDVKKKIVDVVNTDSLKGVGVK
jgi:hypothetical protein